MKYYQAKLTFDDYRPHYRVENINWITDITTPKPDSYELSV